MDAYETNLTVADPTVHRTISRPNVSGLVPVPADAGTSDQVLQSAGTGAAPTWAASSAGGETLLSTTAITTAASQTISSIDQTYKPLRIVVDGAFENSGSQQLFQFNSDASAIYSSVKIQSSAANTVAVATAATSVPLGAGLRFVAGAGSGSIIIDIPNYASATMQKMLESTLAGANGVEKVSAAWGSIAAVTSFKITWGGAPTAQGNILVYGVK